MALEDRIRSSIDQAVKALTSEFLSITNDEVTRQVADVERRLHDEFDEKIAALQERHREQAAHEIHSAVQAETARLAADVQPRFDAQLAAAVADAEAKAVAATHASITAARVAERELEMAGMTRLVESIRGLDGAASLSEVLDALALAAARETARAAVVVLKSDRIIGWRLSGFGARDTHPKSVEMEIAEAGVIGLAVTSARPATTREGGVDGPGFEEIPSDRTGLAMPVLVGGRVVAVVYADGVTDQSHQHTVPSPWPEAIEVLARHAGRCLEALTSQKASTPSSGAGRKAPRGDQAASGPVAPSNGPNAANHAFQMVDDSLEGARRLARLLIAEIRLYHEREVREGQLGRNLLARLAPEIARARQAFDARLREAPPTGADVFHQELVRTLAGGDASLLGAT